MTPGYRFLDHDADLGFEVTAAELLAVWDLSARALTEVMTDASAVRCTTAQRIEVAAPDLVAAWVEFLGELLFFFEAEGLLLCAVEHLEVQPDSTQGGVQVALVARGEPFDERRHPARAAVKAVTHHNATLQQLPDGSWLGRVLLDL